MSDTRIRLTPEAIARIDAVAAVTGMTHGQIASLAAVVWTGANWDKLSCGRAPPWEPPWDRLSHEPPAEGLKPATSGQNGTARPVGGVGGGSSSPNPATAQEEENSASKTQGGCGGDAGQIVQRRQRFTPPTVAEVEAYCRERKNRVNATTFVNFYASKGWMVGKNKMKDWQAAVHTWEQNDGHGNQTGRTPQGQGGGAVHAGRHHRDDTDYGSVAQQLDLDSPDA